MNRSALLMLILCNLVWAFNPLMGKVLLENYTGLQIAWIRYGGAFLAYLIVVSGIIVFGRRKTWRHYFLIPKNFRTWIDVLILAIGPFVLAPVLQFVGLETSQAMDNSILIATEPLITVLLAWLVLGERMSQRHVVAMGLTLFGFFFFSGLMGGVMGEVIHASFSRGMLFLLLGLFGESVYSVFGRKLVQDHSPESVIGTALAIGALILSGIVSVSVHFPNLFLATPRQLGAVIWLGPIGSTLTYLLWAIISRNVTVASMSITLFIQPLFGSAVGFFFLGENLTPTRFFGALLILFGIAGLLYWEVQQELRRRSPI